MNTRDYRNVNLSDGQQVTDALLNDLGKKAYRNDGVSMGTLAGNEGKAVIFKGLIASLKEGSDDTISITAGEGLQRAGDVSLPFTSEATELELEENRLLQNPITYYIGARVESDKVKKERLTFMGADSSISLKSAPVERRYKLAYKVFNKTKDMAGTQAEITGVAATWGDGNFDLSSQYKINLAIGEDGEFAEIDLRSTDTDGENGSTDKATAAKIAGRINTVFPNTASIENGRVKLTAPGTGERSKIHFRACANAGKDALLMVFGLSNGGQYSWEIYGQNEYFTVATIKVEGKKITEVVPLKGIEFREENEEVGWPETNAGVLKVHTMTELELALVKLRKRDADMRKAMYRKQLETRIGEIVPALSEKAREYYLDHKYVPLIRDSQINSWDINIKAESYPILLERYPEWGGAGNEMVFPDLENKVLRSVGGDGGGGESQAGKYQKDGVPNIKGRFSFVAYGNKEDPNVATGPFARTEDSFNAKIKGGGDDNFGRVLEFSASRANPVYGRSLSEVRVKSFSVWFFVFTDLSVAEYMKEAERAGLFAY